MAKDGEKHSQVAPPSDGPLCKQTTDYTCAPAAFLSVLRLRGNDSSEDLISKEIGCTEDGSSLDAMAKFAIENLGATSCGEGTWNFKSACIAVITEDRLLAGKRTHAVIVFPMLGEFYIKYCPYFDDLAVINISDLLNIFQSECGKFRRWSINF